MTPRTAAGIIGATRRSALAALSLHAGLEREIGGDIPEIREGGSHLAGSLLALASAIRAGVAPSALAQQTPLAPNTGTDDVAIDEMDMIADSIDTIADVLTKDAGQRAEPAA